LQEKLEALWKAKLMDIQVEHELENAPLTMAATVAAEKVFKSAHKAKCVKEVVEEAKQHLATRARTPWRAANSVVDDVAQGNEEREHKRQRR
jgi:hypothetical protein